MKLGYRLLLLLLLVALPIFTIQLLRGLDHREDARRDLAAEALRLAQLAAAQQTRLFDSARHLLLLAGQLPEARGLDGPACGARMAAFKSQLPEIGSVGVATPDGTVFCHSDATAPFNVADRAYFQEALRTKSFTLSGFLISRPSGSETLVLAYPLLDAAGGVETVAMATLNLARLGGTLAEMVLPPNASAAVVDRDGVLLTRTPTAEGWVGHLARAPSVMKVLLEQREGIVSDIGIHGIERVFGFAAVSASGDLFVTVGLPVASIFDAANRSFWRETGPLAAIIALAAATALIGGEFAVRRPVVRLQRMVSQLAEGNLAARPPSGRRGLFEIAALTSDVTAMAKSLDAREQSLRASERRFKDFAESSSDWLWETDAEHRFRSFSGRLSELAGVRLEDVIGKRREELLIETAGASDLRVHLDDLAAHRPFRNFTYWAETSKGLRCFSTNGKPVFDDDGRFQGYRGTGTDVTEQIQAEAALRTSEERLRAALSASGTGTFRWDIRTNAIEYDEGMRRLLGRPHGAAIHHLDQLIDLVNPDDRGRVRTTMDRCAADGADLDLDFRVVCPDSSLRWLGGRGQTFRDGGGTPLYMTGACVDITDRKQAEERQSLLMAELDHRVKNTLATVQSVAVQTLEPSAAVDSFRGRLAALAHVHGLLAQSRWQGARLRALISEELAPYQTEGARQIALCGEDVLLTPMAAQTLTLTIHELTTNAAKHGALSTSMGRVEVSWEVAKTADGRRLILRWVERGGPPVTPPTRRGFGTMLIERSLGYELGATVHLRFPPDGVRCEIAFPLLDPAPAALQPARPPAGNRTSPIS